MNDFTTENFTANLKIAASYYPSISEMCRKLGINRQQFMKYLSGRVVPVAIQHAPDLRFLRLRRVRDAAAPRAVPEHRPASARAGRRGCHDATRTGGHTDAGATFPRRPEQDIRVLSQILPVFFHAETRAQVPRVHLWLERVHPLQAPRTAEASRRSPDRRTSTSMREWSPWQGIGCTCWIRKSSPGPN